MCIRIPKPARPERPSSSLRMSGRRIRARLVQVYIAGLVLIYKVLAGQKVEVQVKYSLACLFAAIAYEPKVFCPRNGLR